MRHMFSFFAFILFFVATSAHAGQEVGGLVIDYPSSFKKDTATSTSWLSGMPQNIKKIVVSLDIFTAPPSNGLIDVMLSKSHFVPGFEGSIDGAAAEMCTRISKLDGIKNFQQQVKELSVSGFKARNVSIAADRWGGKLGSEILIVYDKKTNTMWQMQLLFGKKKGFNPFASLNIDDERRYAKNLISSIRVVQ